MPTKDTDKLDLERDIIPFLRRWRAVGCWGDVTIRFKQGEPIQLYPHPVVYKVEDIATYLPNMPQDTEAMPA